MAPKKRYSVVRDPVHGDVYLTHEEIALLDTPEMQRLRGVKQLGTAFLVFPGAVHSRFEHSVGTLHITQRIVDAINLNFELDPRANLGVGEEEARVIRAAALVHDVTHVPYGHNIEDQTGLLPRHDTAERYRAMLSNETELGRVMGRLGLADDVLRILVPDEAEEKGSDIPPYWSQVLSDTICSDLVDYLARDAYFTGLKLAVDERLVNYFKVDRASGNLYIDVAKKNLLREDILSELVRMLEARYYFSERVYYHHAKVAAGALVARAVELALVSGAIADTDLYGATDASLLELLLRKGDERVVDVVRRFQRRKLPKRVCVYPRYENEDAQAELVGRFFARGQHAQRAEVEHRIADVARFATGRDIDVLLYCPAARMQLKEVETHVRWPGSSGVRPLSEYDERVPRLADLERSYRDLWKFYVFADTEDPSALKKLQEIAVEEFPTAMNLYRVEA